MDGNRRWAKRQGLKPSLGHKQMVEEGIKEVVSAAKKIGIKYLTLWAFSTENWHRDPQEVGFLMNLFRQLFSNEAKRLHEEGVRIRTIGDLTRFEQDIQVSVAEWVEKTKNNQEITVIFALNYGGRDEILRAIQQAAQAKGQTRLADEKLTEEEFEKYLDTADFPQVELVIRPGKEVRLSGFLLWQSNYAELYFTDVLMPDFDRHQLEKAIEEFDRRKRNFGK
jgi:undecaprenyl diphosphate synthase